MDNWKNPKNFWHNNIGCPGCFKGYYPDGPAPGQKHHMEPGGCLDMHDSEDSESEDSEDSEDSKPDGVELTKEN